MQVNVFRNLEVGIGKGNRQELLQWIIVKEAFWILLINETDINIFSSHSYMDVG